MLQYFHNRSFFKNKLKQNVLHSRLGLVLWAMPCMLQREDAESSTSSNKNQWTCSKKFAIRNWYKKNENVCINCFKTIETFLLFKYIRTFLNFSVFISTSIKFIARNTVSIIATQGRQPAWPKSLIQYIVTEITTFFNHTFSSF